MRAATRSPIKDVKDLIIRVRRGAVVVGRVLDPLGNPVAGARVVARDAVAQEHPPGGFGDLGRARLVVDESGHEAIVVAAL